jgi:uncharacterized protein (TIGR02001 family)
MRIRNSRFFAATILFGMSAGSIAHADNPSAYNPKLTGSLTVTSDYVFRGITQSNEKPAMQAAVTLGDTTGPYIGAWASNVDFNDGDEAKVELDLSGGYKWAWGLVSFDGGVIYYAYPGASDTLDYDYWEGKLAASVPAGPVTLTGSIFVSPDFFGGSDTAVYANGAASVPLFNSGVTANAAIGHQSIDDEASFGTSDYTDWTGGLSYTWEKFTFSIAYYDTDLSKADCPDGCESRVAGTITRTFP